MHLWIKDPLAIAAKASEGGIVISGSRIVELVPKDASPATTTVDEVYDASQHVILPSLINASWDRASVTAVHMRRPPSVKRHYF